MGQSDSKKIQNSIIDLQTKDYISNAQAEQFMKDYINNSPHVKDVNTFLRDGGVTLFLKNFIRNTYKTTQSDLHLWQEHLDQKQIGQFLIKRKITDIISEHSFIFEKNIRLFENYLLQVSINRQLLSVSEYCEIIQQCFFGINEIVFYFFDNTATENASVRIIRGSLSDQLYCKIKNAYLQDFNYLLETKNVLKQLQQKQKNFVLQILKKQLNSLIDDQSLAFYQKRQTSSILIVFEIDGNIWKHIEKRMQHNKDLFISIAKCAVKLIECATKLQASKISQAIYSEQHSQLLNLFLIENLSLMEIFFKYQINVANCSILFLEEKNNSVNPNLSVQEVISSLDLVDPSDSLNQCLLLESKINEKRTEIRKRMKLINKNLTNRLYLSFNRVGKVNFFWSGYENEFTNKIKELYTKGDTKLSSIFANDNKILSCVRKASRGLCNYEQILKPRNNCTMLFQFNPQGLTQRIQIIIQHTKKEINLKRINVKPLQKIQNSFINNKEQNAIQKLGRQSWLNLFIKNDPKKKVGKNDKTIKNQNYRIRQVASKITPTTDKIFDIDSDSLDIIQMKSDQLQSLVKSIMMDNQFFASLKFENQEFEYFLRDIHQKYEVHNNFFHNFKHGVNVMHTTHLLCKQSAIRNRLSAFDIFILVFSGLCHDVNHRGYNNAYEIASKSQLAIRYNDISVLENHHIAKTFETLHSETNNFLAQLDTATFNIFRKRVISTILKTDMKEHFNLLEKFKQLFLKQEPHQKLTEDQMNVFMGMIVHTSDFGGSVKPFEISYKWSMAINRQFSNQYKNEQKQKLPLSPFMKDLDKIEIVSKNQMCFLKGIVMPLYKALSQFTQQKMAINLSNYLEGNLKEWQKINKQNKIPKFLLNLK